jgi:hypothetical protein
MGLAEMEVEISGDFRQLTANQQDCVVATARALSWAARSLKAQRVRAAGDEPGPDNPAAGAPVMERER